MTAPRRVLAGLMVAFAVAAAMATLTTIRQVRLETSALTHHAIGNPNASLRSGRSA
jgi:hypothetical protein